MATPEAIITWLATMGWPFSMAAIGPGWLYIDREILLEAAGSRQWLQADARKPTGQELRRMQAAGLAGAAAALYVVGGQGLHHPCHCGSRNLQGRGRDSLDLGCSFYFGLSGQWQGRQQIYQ